MEQNTAAILQLAGTLEKLIDAIRESVVPFDVELVNCKDCHDEGSDSESQEAVAPQAPAGEELPVIPAQDRAEAPAGRHAGSGRGCCQERDPVGPGRHRKDEDSEAAGESLTAEAR
jgi:hypothetical protein